MATEFVNQTLLWNLMMKVGISHENQLLRSLTANGVVERRISYARGTLHDLKRLSKFGNFVPSSDKALKYGFESCDPVDTPMVEKSKLDEDKEGKAVDPSHYRGSALTKSTYMQVKKGSLSYLKGTVHRGTLVSEGFSHCTNSTFDQMWSCVVKILAVHIVSGLTVPEIDMQRHTSNLPYSLRYEKFEETPPLGEGDSRILAIEKTRIRRRAMRCTNSFYHATRQLCHAKTLQFLKEETRELQTEDIRNSESYKGLCIASGRFLSQRYMKSSEEGSDEDKHEVMRTVRMMDDDAKKEEKLNEDDTFDPIVHTPSHVSSSDDEDSDNEVEGVDVEGEKSDEDATYVEDQGNEADRDTNANLEGRDDVKADVSSSVSSGFVSNMLNPNQDTGVDAIFGHNAEATSLVDIPVTAIAEPSFFAPTNRPPTPTPLFTQLQQPPILTPATTPSSSLLNLPDFGSLFGFDNRLKALEDNFSEFKQTNQYAEALSSIPGIVDQYLANKMKEAVDVAVQLKSDRIREEAQAENQQFLDSIDEGMKKVIKEQVKSEVSKITPKIEKLVNEQLESEVLVRSSKEAKTSHAVAANLSELELKKILIDKMEANKSINRSDIQRQLYKALVDAYEADKILLDTYGDTVTIKRPRDGADDDQEPSAGTDRGSKRRRSGKEPESTSAPREKTTTTVGKTTTSSDRYKYIKNHKKTVKNGQTWTRESEEYKRSHKFKAKARKSQPSVKLVKPWSTEDDNSSDQQQNGRVNYVKLSTLIGSLKPHGLKEAQEKRGFALIALTKEAHMSLSRIAKLAIRVSSIMIQGLLLTLK
ncbi:hypothetical protein Tco_0428147 [Tanacetum coccineum]